MIKFQDLIQDSVSATSYVSATNYHCGAIKNLMFAFLSFNSLPFSGSSALNPSLRKKISLNFSFWK